VKTEIVDIEEVKELIFSYASGDYAKRAIISNRRDERDTIMGAINMLGEELEETTVSRDYFSSIYNAVAEMLFLVDPSGIIVEYNVAIERELNYNASELMGEYIDKILLSPLNFKDGVLSKVEGSNGFFTDQLNFITKTSEIVPVSVTISKLEEDHDNRLLVIAKNISEQKKTEQLVLQTIIDTEEKERKRLAFDLHDSLGQEINAVKMHLNVASYGKIDAETKANIEKCKTMLEGSIDSIRKIVFNLLPASLDKGNLDIAILQLIESVREIDNVEFEYNMDGAARSIEKRIEIMVYRIVQEFVNNSLKYAKAKRIFVGLNFEDSKLDLYLEDDGVGFDLEIEKSKGNGLKNMTSRVKAVAGELEFFSEIGKGTQLIATFKI